MSSIIFVVFFFLLPLRTRTYSNIESDDNYHSLFQISFSAFERDSWLKHRLTQKISLVLFVSRRKTWQRRRFFPFYQPDDFARACICVLFKRQAYDDMQILSISCDDERYVDCINKICRMSTNTRSIVRLFHQLRSDNKIRKGQEQVLATIFDIRRRCSSSIEINSNCLSRSRNIPETGDSHLFACLLSTMFRRLEKRTITIRSSTTRNTNDSTSSTDSDTDLSPTTT